VSTLTHYELPSLANAYIRPLEMEVEDEDKAIMLEFIQWFENTLNGREKIIIRLCEAAIKKYSLHPSKNAQKILRKCAEMKGVFSSINSKLADVRMGVQESCTMATFTLNLTPLGFFAKLTFDSKHFAAALVHTYYNQ